MKSQRRQIAVLIGVLLTGAVLLWPKGDPVVVLAAFPGPRAAYQEIIPLFQKYWFDTTGRRVRVRASFAPSGAQSRAVAAGFEADVAVFSNAADMLRLERAGLLTHDWRDKNDGMVTGAAVVLAVRDGNPLGVQSWRDLALPGFRLALPHPKLADDGRWAFLGLYGAAERGSAPPYRAGDAAAFRFCKAVFKNAPVLDPDAPRALQRLARGEVDAVLAPDDAVLAAQAAGEKIDRVFLRSTVLAEHPAALIDAWANAHGVRAEAQAFLDFLWTPQAQAVFARQGYRPVHRGVLADHRRAFPPVPDLWTAIDYGGWSELGSVFFGPGGLFDSVMEEADAASS